MKRNLGNLDYQKKLKEYKETLDSGSMSQDEYDEVVNALNEKYPKNANSATTEKPRPQSNKSTPKAKKTKKKDDDDASCNDEVAKLRAENARLKAEKQTIKSLTEGKASNRFDLTRTRTKKIKGQKTSYSLNPKTGKYDLEKPQSKKKSEKSGGSFNYKSGTYSTPLDSELEAEKPKTTQEVKADEKAIEQEAKAQVEKKGTAESEKSANKRGRKPSATPKQAKEIKDKVKAGKQVYAHKTIYNIARRLILLDKKPNVKSGKNLYIFAIKANTAKQWSKNNEGGSVIAKILERMSDSGSVQLTADETKALTQITNDAHVPPSVRLYKSYLNLLKTADATKAKNLATRIENAERLKYMNAQSLMYSELKKILPQLKKGEVPKPALSGLGATKCDNAMSMVSGLSKKGLIYKRKKSSKK